MLPLLGTILSKRFYDKPIFLVGSGRSGTIVLYKALGQHPNILSMPSEDPFITSMGGAAYAFIDEDTRGYYLESVKVSEQYIYNFLRRMCFESAAGTSYGFKFLVKSILEDRFLFLEKRHWCVKTFPNASVARGLLALYPKAKFIYIIRSGIDVVHSRTKFPAFRDKEFAEQCRVWADSIERFNYLRSLHCCITIRQEDLLSDPEVAFQKIFTHIGVDYHKSCADFAKKTLVHSRDDTATHTEVDVKKALFNRKPSYSHWTQEQRTIFKQICGDAMQKVGYEMPL